LKATQEKYASSNLQIIGIAVDFPDAVAAYAEEAEFNYPILVGQEDAMAVAESSGVDFIGLPFTMVVSADGDLLKTHIGEIVEDHIEKITSVLAQMERGELTLDAARSELRSL
jgi:peroxiredoxin